MRNEFLAVQAGFDKLPSLGAGLANTAVVVNSGGTGFSNTAGALALAGDFEFIGGGDLNLILNSSSTLTLPAGATDQLVGRATTDTLTNKSISGSANTLTNIPNSAFVNASLTIGSTNIALGATAATIAGLTLTAPALGTPTSGVLTNCTGLPVASGISGLGTGVATALAVNIGSAGAPVLFNGAGGTPSSLTLTNATGLPNGGLVNASLTIGSTSIALGATVTTIAGLTLTGLKFGLSAAGTVAAATTTDLNTSAANCQTVTGNTTITGFGAGVNLYRILTFTGTPLITYDATSLITPTGANIQAAPGDVAVLTSDGSGHWTIISYTPFGVTTEITPNSSATASFVQYGTINLTPGKWLLSGEATANDASGGRGLFVIGPTTASNSGATFGKNSVNFAIDGSTGSGTGTIVPFAVTVTVNTTYYYNYAASSSSPTVQGFARAQRIF